MATYNNATERDVRTSDSTRMILWIVAAVIAALVLWWLFAALVPGTTGPGIPNTGGTGGTGGGTTQTQTQTPGQTQTPTR